MIGDHEVHSNSQSRDEQDTFASTVDTNDSMDPDSLTAMECSQTLTDDQREASPSLSNPEVGIYEDIGAPIEPKIHELKIAQQFIEHLENATLDNSKIDDWVRERLQHPLTTTVDDMLDPILRLSIDIYLAVSNASQATYDSVCDSLIHFNPDKPILSYDAVKRRITKISGVAPIQEDMCVNTCIAFTGPFSELDTCPECAEPRYDTQNSRADKKVGRWQFYTLPIGPQLQVLWRSPESARSMRHRSERTQQIIDELQETGTIAEYDDIYQGSDYLRAVNEGRITANDMVLLLSIDGAQLYQSKHSDCWIYIWVILDHAPDMRYKKKHILPGGFIGGPNNLKHPDSFMFPGVHHLAAIQKEGLRIWDGERKEIFTSRPFFAFGTADGPGMTHLNGLVGHQGALGCQTYCSMPGRHKKGASQYFPVALKPHNFDVAGCNHGDINLWIPRPLNPASYSSNLLLLLHSSNPTNYKKNRLQTGIVKPSLFSGLPENHTLGIPNCFPLDLMHLVSLNIPDLLLSLWRGTLYHEKDDNKSTWDWAVLHGDVWKEHGKVVASTTPHLPGSFDRPPRNPAEKISSGYKAWEFLLYLFVLRPAVFWTVLPDRYWRHFCKLVFGIRIIHQRHIIKEKLQAAHRALVQFVEEFEVLYYQRNRDRLHFIRQSIHLLIHLALETVRVGLLSLLTQWPLERTIGNLGEEIRQPSNPYANLSEHGLRRSQVKRAFSPNIRWLCR
jgi:hypothetical protein